MSARYLALGDSYTIGEGVDAAQRWPCQLVALLRGKGRAVDDPEIIATTGWTTDELSAAIDRAAPKPTYLLVSLSIGVNNQYRGRPLEDFRVEFYGLLARAIAFADGARKRVMVVSIPDWGVTPFAREDARDINQIAGEIDAFNAIAREIALAAGTHWVDVTDLSRGDARDLLAADGLHPSAEQYALWAARVAATIVDDLPLG